MKILKNLLIFIIFSFLVYIFISLNDSKLLLNNFTSILYSKNNKIVYSTKDRLMLLDLDTNKELVLPIKDLNIKILGNIENNIFYIKDDRLYSTLDLNNSLDIKDIISVDIFNQFIKINKNGKFGILNNSLKEVVPCKFDNVLLGDSLFLVNKEGKFGYLDLNGNEKIPFEYDNAMIDKNGTMIVSKEKKAGVIDFNNNIVIDFDYNYLIYNSGIALARTNKEFYKVEKEKRKNLDISWLGINNDKTLFYEKNSKFGLMSLNGIKITENIYDEILQNNIESIVVNRNNQFGLINQKGEEITEINYEFLYPVKNYFFLGLYNNSSEEILINSKGKEIMKLKNYKDIIELSKNYFILFKNNEQIIYFENGKKIDNIDEIISLQNNYLLYRNNQKIKKLKLI